MDTAPQIKVTCHEFSDLEWQKMRQVWDACVAAGVAIPDQVHSYFHWDPPEEHLLGGRPVNISWKSDSSGHRFEIDLRTLDKSVVVLKFSCPK